MQVAVAAPIVPKIAVAKPAPKMTPKTHPAKLSYQERVQQYEQENKRLRGAAGQIMQSGKPFTPGLPGLPFGTPFYKLQLATFDKKDTVTPRPLVIVFNGIQLWPGYYEFQGTVNKLCVHALYISDPAESWFLTDLRATVPKQQQPASHNGVKQNLEFIKSLIADVPYTHISVLGVSLGGFAALLYGPLLGASHVLAFDPQVFIDKESKVRFGDSRWNDEMKCLHVPHHASLRYQNLPRFLPTLKTPLPAMTIVCGTRNANVHCVVRPANAANFDPKYKEPRNVLLIDEMHALALQRALPKDALEVVWEPRGCHNSAHTLKEKGMPYYEKFIATALAIPEKEE